MDFLEFLESDMGEELTVKFQDTVKELLVYIWFFISVAEK